MKTVIIELPDGRDEALSITAIGQSCNKQITNIHCAAFDLFEGTHLVWDNNKQALVQHHHFEMYDNMPNILQSQWIPVTERLPDENQPVCILLENGNVFRAEIRTRQLLKEWWYRYDPTDEDMDMLGIHYEVKGCLKKNPIVAWMPLPTPVFRLMDEEEDT